VLKFGSNRKAEPLGQEITGPLSAWTVETCIPSQFSLHLEKLLRLLTSQENPRKVAEKNTLTKTNNRRKTACKAHLQTPFFALKKPTYQGALIWCLSGSNSEMLLGEHFPCKTDFIL